jgi:AcrR family transcriptional regulator
MPTATEEMLERVVHYAAEHGITGKSLREIAAGVGTSHRMLIYHFGSREGLLTAIVGDVERRQRELLSAFIMSGQSGREVMNRLWDQVSSPELRPFVRLFFEVFGLAVQGVVRTPELTQSWIETAGDFDAAAVRLGVAVSRGLLLDLLAGADPGQVRAAHDRFVTMMEDGLSKVDDQR